ncbi:MAG: hypothetical protein HOH58_16790 [Opitutaceae bacterium]|nr:hypothetical protein [Opitutaceae bacterium]
MSSVLASGKWVESAVGIASTESTSSPCLPPDAMTWLVRYAGFPARRLEPWAEQLVLLSALAQAQDHHGGRSGDRLVRQDSRDAASQRQQAENRRKAHFKSNNRTKV